MRPRNFALLFAIGACLSACTERAREPAVEAAPPVTPSTASPEAPDAMQRLIALGNEPFWSVEVDGSRLVWKTPEMLDGKTFIGERVTHADVLVLSGRDSGGIAFVLEVRAGECSDGMSDNVYAFTSSWRYGDQVFSGCAKRR